MGLKEDSDKEVFDALATATWNLFLALRSKGFSRKEAFSISKEWLLTCVRTASQRSEVISALLTNIPSSGKIQ